MIYSEYMKVLCIHKVAALFLFTKPTKVKGRTARDIVVTAFELDNFASRGMG